MNAELSQLEYKLDQILALCQSLRADNHELRTRVAGLEAERRRLGDKLETACARLEALLEKVPTE